MLLHKDLIEMKQRLDHLLMLSSKLKDEPHDGYTNYNQHLFSSKSKDLFKFFEEKMKRPDIGYDHRNVINCRQG